MDSISPTNELQIVRDTVDALVKDLRMLGRSEKGGREVALAITKLQEARLWAGEALKEMGYFEKKSKEKSGAKNE